MIISEKTVIGCVSLLNKVVVLYCQSHFMAAFGRTNKNR